MKLKFRLKIEILQKNFIIVLLFQTKWGFFSKCNRFKGMIDSLSIY